MQKAPLSRAVKLHLPLFVIVRMICSTAFRMVYPFLPAFRDGLGVSLETLSRAIGFRSLIAALVGPFFAGLADTRGRKFGMLTGTALFILGTAVVVFWPTFPGFVIALMLTTIGKVTFDPSMQAYLGDNVPYNRRSFALTITELSWSGAYILGVPLVGLVIARSGWLAPFPLLGLLVLFMAIILAVAIPKDPAPNKEAPKFWSNFGTVVRSKPARAALALTFLSCIGNEIINLVFGVWMEDSFGLKLAALGAAAAVLGIAELSGEGAVALFTDRLGKRRAIFIGLLVNSLAVAALPFTAGNLTAALIGLFLFYISFEFLIVSSLPLMTEVLPNARATVMAGFFTSASIGRALAAWVAPPLYLYSFWAAVGAALLFNVLSIFSLRQLQLDAEDGLRNS
jgi:predicted MFS family arabinose efflux permease